MRRGDCGAADGAAAVADELPSAAAEMATGGGCTTERARSLGSRASASGTRVIAVTASSLPAEDAPAECTPLAVLEPVA
jgi:hypothetical protein